ncbi:NADP-binding protein [Pseudoalteromonas sp. S4488]|uniref:NADP-binding protein n=1 Tax=unclassified Pseudoalteromonas TaxID=194690 RepID=UPI001022FFA1|nr:MULTISPECIES: NADP-binding protein [unclassified Pseudoalteromonas]RZF79697.1 NADP-binding protein [Pseudoalteromonas sp. CO109Y]TMO32418.1 NADP-binding protein [Pseudoalteromonas sp. S4491]TMO40271.1 NADP-binding protein [Pseudoalteromonas sp. S4488]
MTVSDNKMVVLGAGWLGQALCIKAKELAWQVQGTHRSREHEHHFQRQFAFAGDELVHDVSLEEAWWVCAIPPRSRSSESNYLATLQAGLELAKQLKCKGFILCSSTGVYPADNGHYDESTAINCQSARQQLLFDAEQLVLNAGGKVLRLAGLVGPGRDPGKFVAGKELSSSSQQVVNMVQQQDVIAAIFSVIGNWSSASSIYNVVNPAHPTKVDYYQQKCAEQGNQPPTFTSHDKGERLIDGSAIESLNFRYQAPI